MESKQIIKILENGNFVFNNNEYEKEVLANLISNGSFYEMIENTGEIEIRKTTNIQEEQENNHGLVFNTGLTTPFEYNRIVFGAPGTGKSHIIEEDRKELLSTGGTYERITFHEDYTYSNFVGTYKPIMIEISDVHNKNSLKEQQILSILKDNDLTGQEKYDQLYETFKASKHGLSRLPILIGIYSNDKFISRKKDGTNTSTFSSVERDHGRAIRPFINYKDNQIANDIGYEYVPGPFMRLYVKAMRNARSSEPKPHLLIIEEINRAPGARVFGDIFQLLDRNEYGFSEYPIESSEDIKSYLSKELGGSPADFKKIRIPNNMFLWATMNSADQGVKPMDTAFKRRWDFDYINIDDGEDIIKSHNITIGQGNYKRSVNWNELRKLINKELISYNINEDKLIGPFFLSPHMFKSTEVNGSDVAIKNIKYKLLMYLFEDAAKMKRKQLFGGVGDGFNSFSNILKTFDERGIFVFNSNISQIIDNDNKDE